MAKITLTLAAAPTFKTPVLIPVPGQKPVPVEFTFKAKKRDEFQEFAKTLDGREHEDVLMEIASGWDLAEPFDKENVVKLVENYLGAGNAVLKKYLEEMSSHRMGN